MKVNGEDLSSIEKNANEIEYYNSFTKIFKKIFISDFYKIKSIKTGNYLNKNDVLCYFKILNFIKK